MYLQQEQELEKRVLDNMINKKEKKVMGALAKRKESAKQEKDDFKESGKGAITPQAKSKGETKTKGDVNKPKQTSDVKKLIKELINKGTHTRQQIVDTVIDKYPAKAVSTVNTYITDSKNPKYGFKWEGKTLIAKVDKEGHYSWK